MCELFSVTVERQGSVNSGADLNQKSASEQAKQNTSHSSLPSGNSGVSFVAAVNLDAAKEDTDDRIPGGNPIISFPPGVSHYVNHLLTYCAGNCFKELQFWEELGGISPPNIDCFSTIKVSIHSLHIVVVLFGVTVAKPT